MAVSLQAGDLDACLELISSILIEDLFGAPAEERESGENVAKIPESKTPQSYNCYEIVAQYLSPRLIPNLLTPVKEVSGPSLSCENCESVRSMSVLGRVLIDSFLGTQEHMNLPALVLKARHLDMYVGTCSSAFSHIDICFPGQAVGWFPQGFFD